MVLAVMHLETLPWGAFLLHSTPYHTMQNRTIPYKKYIKLQPTIQNRTYHTKPHQTIPYHPIQHSTYHSIPYEAMHTGTVPGAVSYRRSQHHTHSRTFSGLDCIQYNHTQNGSVLHDENSIPYKHTQNGSVLHPKLCGPCNGCFVLVYFNRRAFIDDVRTQTS